MIRIVLDTNVFISAILTPTGLPAQVLLPCLTDPDLHLCISADIYAEYEEVVGRPKFKRSVAEIGAILNGIRESSIWIRPTGPLNVCGDPDDNIFLECAQAADADFLVTGNTRHFPESWQRTQIVTPRGFVDAMA